MTTTLVRSEKSTVCELIDCQMYSDYAYSLCITGYVPRFIKYLQVKTITNRRVNSKDFETVLTQSSGRNIEFSSASLTYTSHEPLIHSTCVLVDVVCSSPSLTERRIKHNINNDGRHGNRIS